MGAHDEWTRAVVRAAEVTKVVKLKLFKLLKPQSLTDVRKYRSVAALG